MTTFCIGWDVGAWYCKGAKSRKRGSRDAVCVLVLAADGTLTRFQPVVTVWGNIREKLVRAATLDEVLARAFGVEIGQDDQAVMAIDAALGWPIDFSKLLAGQPSDQRPGSKQKANPYLLRQAERALIDRGFNPLSAVADRIGSQSTKALHFLRRFEMAPDERAVWKRNSLRVVETYPTPVRKSKLAEDKFNELFDEKAFNEALGENRVAIDDARDALRCAIVAAIFCQQPTKLIGPPENDRRVQHEGWIWIPSDVPNQVNPGPRGRTA